jgi:hypothetical protein
MPEQTPHSFTEKSVKRIAAVVKAVESQPTDLTGDPNRYKGNREVWGKITGSVVASGVYKHSWTEQRRIALGFEEVPDGRSGTTTANYAIANDLKEIKTGLIVRLALNIAEDGTSRWTMIGANHTRGQYQGQVYQMVSQLSEGWDYPILHAP